MNQKRKSVIRKVLGGTALVLVLGGMSWSHSVTKAELSSTQQQLIKLQEKYNEQLAECEKLQAECKEELALRDKVLEDKRKQLDEKDREIERLVKIEKAHKECPTRVKATKTITSSAKGRTLTVDSDITVASVTSGEILDKGLLGNLKGLGQVFVDAGLQYGVDPLFLASISAQESGWGKYDHNKNNIFGIGSGSVSFSSKSECIYYTARLLRNNYINQGLNTPRKIQKKYCPNPTDWHFNVVACSRTITNNL